MYYYTDYTNLHINGRSAFATFAKPDEMVVILRLPTQSIEWFDICYVIDKA